MTTTAGSMDKAASGYIRHRFVRALGASFVVFAVFGVFAVSFIAVANAVAIGAWDQVIAAPLGLLLVGIIFLLPIVIVVGLLGGA